MIPKNLKLYSVVLIISIIGNFCTQKAEIDFSDLNIVSQEELQALTKENSPIPSPIKQPVSLPEFPDDSDDKHDEYNEDKDVSDHDFIVGDITVVGNKNVPLEAILYAVPYRVGQAFTPLKMGALIRNVYALDYFTDIRLWAKRLDERRIKLIIAVEESPLINSVTYVGNKHLRPYEVEKRFAISDMRTANSQRLDEYARQIKKMYAEKNYHEAKVTPYINLTPQDTADVVFEIEEGRTSQIKRVFFEGNKRVSSKKLRSLIFTQEDWIFGAITKAGIYHPEAIEMDKHVLENFYQSSGFLMARVTDVRIEKDVRTNDFMVTFVIDEGECFFVDEVHIPGNDLVPEPVLLQRVGIFPGQRYSKEAIRGAMEALRTIWGEFGYVNAEIVPHIEPDFERRTVAITLESFLGGKVFVNHIAIIGNNKTRDHVIRRQLTLHEGDLLSGRDLDRSRLKVEGLGFFDPRDGVNWRVKPIGEDLADLELWLKEIKTGKFYTSLSTGGSLQDLTSPATALKFNIVASDNNILGTGMSGYISVSAASDEQTLTLNLTEPWLFDRPILGALDVYYKNSRYDEIKSIITPPQEQLAGASAMAGVTSYRMYDTRFISQAGFENIKYTTPIIVSEKIAPDALTRESLAMTLKRRFQEGPLAWVTGTALQDFRSNPVHPNRGYQWSIAHKLGLPAVEDCFSFYKFEADATYYTPIIGEYDLVFMIHAHLGFVTPLFNRNVPYRELFHIGGPATVRGFKFGEIGPQLNRDSLGAQKTFFVNTELIFPITRDLSIKGAVFYDGGAGWDTLDSDRIPPGFLKNNRFDYRHAIGFGLRMLQPQPVRIDWGFKLDKRKGENEFEFSLTTLHEF